MLSFLKKKQKKQLSFCSSTKPLFFKTWLSIRSNTKLSFFKKKAEVSFKYRAFVSQKWLNVCSRAKPPFAKNDGRRSKTVSKEMKSPQKNAR
jgi:hypothetical protein